MLARGLKYGKLMSYFPSGKNNDWETISPDEAGFNAARLADAVKFAEIHESPRPRDLEKAGDVPGLSQFEPPPWDQPLGPFKPRGGPAGVIISKGRIAAQWGDVTRTDMTFSIAKSYLSVLTGLAKKENLIHSIDDRAGEYVNNGLFAGEHNGSITWRHLLNQTSEWEGTLFDKPDLVDRNRQVGPGSDNSRKGQHRDLQPPGTFWEYNDVRVNLLSLALLHLFKKPLPEVLHEKIMEPIGASNTWRWLGYDNSWVEIDGISMQSVPGGTHWGGGMHISTLDHARFALLIHRDGTWNDNQILSRNWCQALHAPCDINPGYGFLWWLNTAAKEYPGTPEASYAAVGAGTNIIWIDPDDDLIVVARWVDQNHVNGLLKNVVLALA